MKRYIRRPSPALVISCIALFMAMGGVSYGLATGVIDGREVKDRSLSNKDLKKRTLRGDRAKAESFGGGAIKESTLAPVPFASGILRAAVVNPAGAIVRERGGATSLHTGPGRYAVSWPSDIRGCIYQATIGDESTGAPGAGLISVSSLVTNPNSVLVRTKKPNNDPDDRSFHLLVSC
jgi:hypothetical protein